jgi:hypothetical protein
LRAAHAIDSPSERTAGRRADAEEPVTARIRRRAEALTEAALLLTPQQGGYAEREIERKPAVRHR